jgi:tRNA(Arg) A34 adenosine deaminase TadA
MSRIAPIGPKQTDRRRVVFLDVDGVSTVSASHATQSIPCLDVLLASAVVLFTNRGEFDESCMRCLKRLVDSCGEKTELVLSSNWKRSPPSMERLNAALAQYHIRPIQSTTPECEYDERGLAFSRAAEIQLWLGQCPAVHKFHVDSWVALDDLDLGKAMPTDDSRMRCIITNRESGLNRANADAAIAVLTRQPFVETASPAASVVSQDLESSAAHDVYIRRAVELAAAAVEKGNHPFGACLVLDGKVLLEAENTVVSGRDHTGHAELNLVKAAHAALDAGIIERATLYTSTEPCMMCCGAIYWSGISHVVYACSEQTLAKFAGADFLMPSREVFARGARRVLVEGPVLEDLAAGQHAAFWPRAAGT